MKVMTHAISRYNLSHRSILSTVLSGVNAGDACVATHMKEHSRILTASGFYTRDSECSMNIA